MFGGTFLVEPMSQRKQKCKYHTLPHQTNPKYRAGAERQEVGLGEQEKPVAETVMASPTEESQDPCLGFKLYQLLGGTPFGFMYFMLHPFFFMQVWRSYQTLVLTQHGAKQFLSL